MKNVLILTSAYSGIVGASGICTRMLVDELKNRGYNVWIIAYDTGVEEENVYNISYGTGNERKNGIISVYTRIKQLFFPHMNNQIEAEFAKKSLEICKLHNIDTLICVYFPLESISVLRYIKKCFASIKTVVYELDSVGDGIFSSSKLNLLAKRRYEIWMNNNYKYADLIIIMNCHQKYWENVFGKKNANKFMLADIPILCNRIKNYKKSKIPTMLYAGLLSMKYRSPQCLLMIFDELTKCIKTRLEFYSKGDCERLISSYIEGNSMIFNHGYVEPDVLDEAINRADVLVSIGNRVSNSIPSKLITYFSYGKPVIHITSKVEDVCVEYVNKYPLGLVLYENVSPKENALKICSFFKDCIGKSVSYSEVSSSLYMNTPKYSVDLIEKS